MDKADTKKAPIAREAHERWLTLCVELGRALDAGIAAGLPESDLDAIDTLRLRARDEWKRTDPRGGR